MDSWRRPPGSLLVVLGAITVGSAAALGWLGWEMLRRDEVVEVQRQAERLDLDADRVVQEFERQLADIEARLTKLAGEPATTAGEWPDAGVGVVLTRTSVSSVPHRLLFYPVVPVRPEPSSALFAQAEDLEFRARNPQGAALDYRRIAQSPDRSIRAAALMRLGRALSSSGQTAAALDAFGDMALLGDVSVIGLPADLVACQERARLLDQLRKKEDARSAASELVKDLINGRWMLMRGQFEHYVDEATRVAGAAAVPVHEVAWAQAVSDLWTTWQSGLASRGRLLQRFGETSVLVVWRAEADGLVAWLAEPSTLVARLSIAGLDPAIVVALSDDRGFVTPGVANGSRKVHRTAVETRLPWTVHVSRTATATDEGRVSRAPLVIAGLALMLVFLAAGSYFIGRAIKREADLARLQSDFVSAVSHEFRTPLAAMRQFSELLAAGRVQSEEKRQHYFESLAGESRRLQRLVESLLNFGKLESGAGLYHFEAVRPREFVESVVSEYRAQLSRPSCPIEVAGADNTAAFLADRNAVALALHNLLDNAVKYSGGDRPVHIDWTRQGDRIAVSVRDQGPGIAADEQHRIFQKFVRGGAAAAANVRGTGVGLAVVQLVAKAHGGEVVVTSQPGAGATFTMFLPVATGEPRASEEPA